MTFNGSFFEDDYDGSGDDWGVQQWEQGCGCGNEIKDSCGDAISGIEMCCWWL